MNLESDLILKIIKWLESKEHVHPYIKVRGWKGSLPCMMLSLIKKKTHRKLAIITPDDQVMRVASECEEFLKGAGLTYPKIVFLQPREFFPGTEIKLSAFSEMERIKTLYQTAMSDVDAFILSAKCLMEKVISKNLLTSLSLKIIHGKSFDHENLIIRLSDLGYEREFTVEEPGQFSVRGGIIDVFSPLYEFPVRLDFFGDTIESLKSFDPITQRSKEKTGEYMVLPVSDQELEWTQQNESPVTYLSDDTILTVIDPDAVKTDMKNFWEKIAAEYTNLSIEPQKNYLSPDEALSYINEHKTIFFDYEPAVDSQEEGLNIDIEGCLDIPSLLRSYFKESSEFEDKYSQKGKIIAEITNRLCEEGYHVIFFSEGDFSASRFKDFLGFNKIQVRKALPDFLNMKAEIRYTDLWPSGKADLAVGHIEEGFLYEPYMLAIIPEQSLLNLFDRNVSVVRRASKPAHKSWDAARSFIELIREINIGDPVVHIDYGIGMYKGLIKLKVDNYTGDFLLLEYRDGDRLYIPVQKMDRIQKYAHTSDEFPKLSKLGSFIWEKKKKAAAEAAQELAHKLLNLYAERQSSEGYCFSLPDELFREFEAGFPHDLTPDQEQAIDDVLSDMMRPICMERLVCGDVGFGKTEVAIRASFKAVLDGKQVAVLVPTTVLCEQHRLSFQTRFEKYPVIVESLSRLQKKGDQKRILDALEQGGVDIIIGTHKLLMDDVKFRDLGLVIIDEEHRFGVAQKEKIREIKKNVDTILLSATPIPRTLNMALSGIRNMSIIASPPRNRLSVKTYVAPYNEKIIRQGVIRELERGGQVFFLHNRVQDIMDRAKELSAIIPEARILVAHGQINPQTLTKVMTSFINKEADVLVCSSIIESGIDIPSVNTIFIERADQFGLSQLYQIRGRVGRSSEQAFAFLLLPENEQPTADAVKRISVLRRFSELSSGFTLSMFDLQIRGSGEILGKQQSGYIHEVGYEMYVDMLDKAVKKLKGLETKEEKNLSADPEIKIKADVYIPDNYIEDQHIRLLYYKKLACANTESEVGELRNEMTDRFGTIPIQVSNLTKIAILKILARNLHILSLIVEDKFILIHFTPTSPISFDCLLKLTEKSHKKFKITSNEILKCESVFPLFGESVCNFAIDVLKEIACCVNI